MSIRKYLYVNKLLFADQVGEDRVHLVGSTHSSIIHVHGTNDSHSFHMSNSLLDVFSSGICMGWLRLHYQLDSTSCVCVAANGTIFQTSPCWYGRHPQAERSLYSHSACCSLQHILSSIFLDFCSQCKSLLLVFSRSERVNTWHQQVSILTLHCCLYASSLALCLHHKLWIHGSLSSVLLLGVIRFASVGTFMLLQAIGAFMFLRSLITFRDIRKIFYGLMVGSAGAVFVAVVALTYAGMTLLYSFCVYVLCVV